MIVKKVRLENWAIFREPTEVEFSDGLIFYMDQTISEKLR